MKDVGSALGTVNAKLKTTETELKEVQKQLKFDPKNTELLAQRQELLGKRVADSRTKLDTLNSMLEQHTAKMQSADHVTEEMEAEHRALVREIEKTKNQIENFSGELDKVSKKTTVVDKLIKPFNKLGEAIQKPVEKIKAPFGKLKSHVDDLRASVQRAKEEHPKLTAAIEKAGEVSKKVASGGVKLLKGAFAGAAGAASAVVAGTAAIVKGLTDLAGSASEAGDKIEKQSQKVGMSAESYQKWDYVMNISGTSMSNCTTGLKTLTNQFEKAKSGSEGAQDKFKRLGLSLDDLKGKSREEVFEATVKALQGVQDETEKAALANALFGKSGQDLMPLFNQSAEATQELMEKAKECGMVMSNDAVNASAKYQDSLTTLQSTATAMKNNIVAELLPGMTSVLDGLTAALTGDEGAEKLIEDGINDMMNALDTILPRLGGIFDRVAGVVLETAPQIIVLLADGLISRLDEITATAFRILSALTEGLLTEKNLKTIMKAAVDIITNLVGFLADNVDLLIDSAFLCVTSLADALLSDDNVEKLIQASLDIILSLAIGLIDHLPELIDACFRIVEAVVAALLQYDWTEPGKQILLGLIEGLGKVVSSLLRTIKNIGKSLLDAFKNVLGIHSPSTVFEGLGKNLLQGLWNGIANIKDWLIKKIRGLGSSITGALKSVFGIASPSKVFENEIGKNLGLGIGVGFEKAMDTVKDDMQNAIPTDFDLPDPDFNFPKPGGFSGGAFPYYAQTAPEGTGKTMIINLSLNIDKFNNNRDEDIDQLADEFSEVLAAKLQRKEAAFA